MRRRLLAVAVAWGALAPGVVTSEGVADRADEICPLLLGAPAPEVSLGDAWGQATTLHRALGGRPSALVFYRGGFSEAGRAHLTRLKAIEEELEVLGVQVLAISPDAAASMVETAQKVGGSPRFRLFSDPTLAVARAFGVARRATPGELRELAAAGVDLRKRSGGVNPELLPVPGVFVIGRDGRVAFAHVNPEGRGRLAPEVLLAVARTLNEDSQGRGEK